MQTITQTPRAVAPLGLTLMAMESSLSADSAEEAVRRLWAAMGGFEPMMEACDGQLERFRRRQEDEAEYAWSPVSEFIADLPRGCGRSTSDDVAFIAAERYVERTRYLLPILDDFSRDCLRWTDGRVWLFLRDGLAFWPSLWARAAIEPGFVAYARCHREVGSPPVFIADRETSPDLNRDLLADVGLWGTLILDMVQHGWSSKSAPVLFLASRNPHIEGWANSLLGARVLAGQQHDLVDIVRLADTVESLIKPFTFAPQAGPGLVRPADRVSLACAAALAWTLHDFTRRRIAAGDHERCDWIGQFRRGYDDPAAWCVRGVTPKSSDGEQLLREWDCGPLPPRNKFCGFAL
jgi:hypothetical protein